MKASICIIDDDTLVLKSLERLLTIKQFVVSAFDNPIIALNEISSNPEKFNLIITDQKMPEMLGTELAKTVRLNESLRHIPIIILSAYSDFNEIVESFNRQFIQLFIAKPWKTDDLITQIGLLTQKEKVKTKKIKLESFHGILTGSQNVIDLFEMIKKIAKSDTTISLTGPSGTGKELFARAIHTERNIKSEPFIAVNCANFNQDIFESQFFGHKKGAFTGADSDSKGLLQQAHNGVLFLDEIGELPLNIQAKILRVIEYKEFLPLGGEAPLTINTKIITATNRNLERMVEQGTFRQDLFYRINVIPFVIPALADRGADAILLLKHFYTQKSGGATLQLSKKLEQFFNQYHWPGNIRELQNIIDYITTMHSNTPVLDIEHLPAFISTNKKTETQSKSAITKDLLTQTLKELNYNQTAVAQTLQVSRMTIWRLMNKFGL